MKKHVISQSQSVLDSFKSEETALFITTLSENKIKIVQLLEEGYYAAAIARRMGLSRSYVSRFVTELLANDMISLEYINPLTRRARSYRVKEGLKSYLLRVKSSRQPNTTFTLSIPHKVRYRYPITDKVKPISLNTGRFAAAKLKHTKTWCMVGGARYVFETTHDHVGKIGIIVHPNSMEVYQRDRHTILANSTEEATNIVAMALNDTANRFVQEQGWENVYMGLGQPKLVGSPHYAFNSKIAKRVVAAGQSMIQVGNGMEIDESLKAKGLADDLAEIETDDIDEANLVDIGLRNAANIYEIVPELVKKELYSVSEAITGMNERAEKIDTMCNNVQALCQSGLPMTNQFNQLTGIVAQQGRTINLIQETMLQLVSSMGKIIEKMGIQQ